MQAAFRDRYCNPAELEVREITRPEPRPTEILVRVHATTVNRTDCAVLTGKPFIMRFFVGLMRPKSPVPGTDFAGVVEAVGSSVTRFKTSDRVFGFNDQGLASQAEYMTIAETAAIAKIPDGVDFDRAAANLEAAHYAYNFLNTVNLSAGQQVLVNGATGGIGSAMLQFLKHYGMVVTAVCDTKNIALVRSLGATKVIDYLKEDFTQLPERFDFVFDAVGKSTFGKCKPLLKDGGIYISSELGPGGQNIFLPLITALFSRKKVKFPLPTDIPRSIHFISELLVSGEFKPVIEKSYPLERISEAYAYVNSGQKTGNVVIELT